MFDNLLDTKNIISFFETIIKLFITVFAYVSTGIHYRKIEKNIEIESQGKNKKHFLFVFHFIGIFILIAIIIVNNTGIKLNSDTAIAERDAAYKARDKAIEERNAADEATKIAITERDAAYKVRDKAINERDVAYEKINAIKNENVYANSIRYVDYKENLCNIYMNNANVIKLIKYINAQCLNCQSEDWIKNFIFFDLYFNNKSLSECDIIYAIRNSNLYPVIKDINKLNVWKNKIASILVEMEKYLCKNYLQFDYVNNNDLLFINYCDTDDYGFKFFSIKEKKCTNAFTMSNAIERITNLRGIFRLDSRIRII